MDNRLTSDSCDALAVTFVAAIVLAAEQLLRTIVPTLIQAAGRVNKSMPSFKPRELLHAQFERAIQSAVSASLVLDVPWSQSTLD